MSCFTDTSRAHRVYQVAGALKIRGCLRSTKSFRRLNEDDSVVDRSDELYAGVRLLNPGGATIRSDETNRLHGRW